MSSYPKVFTDLRSTRSHVCTRAGGSPATRENLRFWRWILMGPGDSLAFLGEDTRCTGNCCPDSNWAHSRTWHRGEGVSER